MTIVTFYVNCLRKINVTISQHFLRIISVTLNELVSVISHNALYTVEWKGHRVRTSGPQFENTPQLSGLKKKEGV